MRMTRASSRSGQVIQSAATAYETEFVPALFREWAPRVAELARVSPGQSILDVACGTGILTREVSSRGARATGLDCNAAMLQVARELAPDITWCEAPAERLPFEDGTFDSVVCQFGLMFFEDRVDALREMLRVTRGNGRIVLAVWSRITESEGYDAYQRALARLFGDDIANAMSPPFSLGDPTELVALVKSAGAERVQLRTITGSARFPSIAAWTRTSVRSWTLADVLDDDAVARLTRELERELSHCVQKEAFVFQTHAHLVEIQR